MYKVTVLLEQINKASGHMIIDFANVFLSITIEKVNQKQFAFVWGRKQYSFTDLLAWGSVNIVTT